MDQSVKKRMALSNGQEWYQLETMMITLQQIGRGVRGPDDACQTYILDHMMAPLLQATRKHLTNGFKQSIHWEKQHAV